MSEEKWLETNNGIEYKTGFDAKLWHGIITSKVDPIRQYQ